MVKSWKEDPDKKHKEESNMIISNDIKYIGVNDHEVDLFEGQYAVPRGMAYNSYAVIDEKVAIMDSVDARFAEEWLGNIREVLGEKEPDYLVVQHMEPDHSGSIFRFAERYSDAVIVSSAQAFTMMKNFFGTAFAERRTVVTEGDSLALGKHTLNFVTAPMVHWPEVIMTYESTEKVLFAADGFGKFGALDRKEADWVTEARRYFIGIVGKYGAPVQTVLKKAATLDIQAIYPLHGPVITENLGYYIGLYNTWSSYAPEEEGVVIAYTSVYGHTAEAALKLEALLREQGQVVVTYDLARCDIHQAVADAFRFSRLVLAAPTYNGDIFPYMRQFIDHLTSRSYANRTIAFIENGSWAPTAGRVMKDMLGKSKNLTFIEPIVTVRSALSEESEAQLKELAQALK